MTRRSIQKFAALSLIATPVATLAVNAGSQGPAAADTETQGDTLGSYYSGVVTEYFCSFDPIGICDTWHASDIEATAYLKTEMWKDASNNTYTKMVQDGWQGYYGRTIGLQDDASIELDPTHGAKPLIAYHYNGSTEISTPTPDPHLACYQYSTTPYNWCGVSDYNNSGHHFYSPWTDDNDEWFQSQDGYLGTTTLLDDVFQTGISG